jgi:hypothetical protein
MTDLTIYEKQINPITKKAEAIIIDDSRSMKDAVELLSTLNKKNDEITEEKEKVTKPLNEALKAERGRWKPFETILDGAIATLRSKISTYQTEQSRIAEAEAEKIAARTKEGKGNFSTETAIKKLQEIEKPEEAVSTDAGTVKFRTRPKLVIDDESLIPREYMIVVENMVIAALKAGTQVPGAHLEEVQTVVNYR